MRRLMGMMGDKGKYDGKPEELVAYIELTSKPIIFTLGLDYKKPTHYKEEVTLEQFKNYLEQYPYRTVIEYDDCIYLHSYTDNDMF